MIDFANTSELDNTNHLNDFYNDMYTRTTHRVRRALFPEILIEDDLNEDEYFANSSSIVNQFAYPSVLLKEAVLNLLSFRDEVENITDKTSQFIKSLNHSDQAVVANAVNDVYLFAKEDLCLEQLSSNKQLVEALINALNSSNDDDTRKNVVAVLNYISSYETGRRHIFRSNGIQGLIQMLNSKIEAIVHYAVCTLHKLLVYVAAAKDEIIAFQGLESFVPLLSASNPRLQALIADCLYFLLLDRPECKQIFLSLKGPFYLISVLQSQTNYIKLIYAVVRCIRSISTDPQNKASLISLKGLETLHKIFPHIENNRKLAVLNAMRNLSDVATNLNTLTGLVVDLIILIKDRDWCDKELVICVCGILSNLTCNNIDNKQAVCSSKGISVLADILHRFYKVEDITEPALCTLRHCTVRHPLAQHAQDELRYHHPIILRLLNTRCPPIVKAAFGLVRNCALSQVNLQSIISEKTPRGDSVVTIAIEILEKTGFELQKNFNGVTEGVSLLEMVEGAISALHQLARDQYVAQFIYNYVSIVNILVNLMAHEQISNNDDELMMREIMGLIYQLTKTPEGAKAIKLCNPEPYIFNALSSSHKPVAAYASIILKNLGIDKPMEYSQNSRFGTTESNGHRHHNNSGEMGWQNDGMEPELYNELYNCPSLGDLRNDHIESSARNNDWYDTDL